MRFLTAPIAVLMARSVSWTILSGSPWSMRSVFVIFSRQQPALA